MIPIRDSLLNYGKQTIDDDDINAVLSILKSDYLTTGPLVNDFEQQLCDYTGMKYGVAVSNGTAALHCATHAANLKQDDEVIVTTLSFVASANCIVYQGATPIFADINEHTMNIDIDDVEAKITNNTKAIIAVDFAGQLCDYKRLRQLANKHNLLIIQDASHSLGVTQHNKYPADLITFSFHPVKNITTGEGGAIMTNNKQFCNRMKQFRNHGIDMDYKNRHLHYYSMTDIGFNYRLTDFQCALGISQLKKLNSWIDKRQRIAAIYDNAFNDLDYIEPLRKVNDCAYHIYVIKLKHHDRDAIYKLLRHNNIGVNVHYKPIHLQPYYQLNHHTYKGLCPIAESVYDCILTLPIFPTMSDKDIDDVIHALIL